jgi:hypothetical protein
MAIGVLQMTTTSYVPETVWSEFKFGSARADASGLMLNDARYEDGGVVRGGDVVVA